MAFKSSSSFIHRATSSIMVRRSFQRQICVPNLQTIGGQFSPLLRFLTASAFVVDNTTKVTEHKSLPKDFIYDGEGLPFVVRDAYNKGTLTLIRKCQDELIRIDVTPYRNVLDYYDDECIQYYGDAPLIKPPNLDEIDSLKQQNPDQVVDVNPCLHFRLQIWHGHMYTKHMLFDVLAFPDRTDKIFIRRMFARYGFTADDPIDLSVKPYLDDFEDFLKIRGLEPSRLKPFFEHFENLESQYFRKKLKANGY